MEMETQKAQTEKIPGFPKTHSLVFKEDGKEDRGIQIYPDGNIKFFGGYAPNVGKPDGFEPHFKEAVMDFWKQVLEKAPKEVTPEYVKQVFTPLKELFFKTSQAETRDYWGQVLKEAAKMFWDQVQEESPTKILSAASDQMNLLSNQFEDLQRQHEKQGQELEGMVKSSKEVLDLISEKEEEIERLEVQVITEQSDKQVQVESRDREIKALEEKNQALQEQVEELEGFKKKMQAMLAG